MYVEMEGWKHDLMPELVEEVVARGPEGDRKGNLATLPTRLVRLSWGRSEPSLPLGVASIGLTYIFPATWKLVG